MPTAKEPATGRYKLHRGKHGFTLIEMLLVIVIIGVLAVIVIVATNPGKRVGQARDATRKAHLRSIVNALEQYYTLNGAKYPSTGGNWQSHCTDWGGLPVTGPTGYIPNLAPNYIKELPRDPFRGANLGALRHPLTGTNGTNTFCYIYRSNGTDYKVAAYCGVESETVLTGQEWYSGRPFLNCPDNAYGIYTPGAVTW